FIGNGFSAAPANATGKLPHLNRHCIRTACAEAVHDSRGLERVLLAQLGPVQPDFVAIAMFWLNDPEIMLAWRSPTLLKPVFHAKAQSGPRKVLRHLAVKQEDGLVCH